MAGAFDSGFDESFDVGDGAGAQNSNARRRQGRVSLGLFLGLTRRLGSAGEPPERWTPADISDIYAYYDLSKPETITEVAGVVAQLDDLSGNDHHLTQSLAAARPTYNETEQRLEFDGFDDTMTVEVTDWVSGNADAAVVFGGISFGATWPGQGGEVFVGDGTGAGGKGLAITQGNASNVDTNLTWRFFNGAGRTADQSTDQHLAMFNYTTRHADATARYNGAATTQTPNNPTNVMSFNANSTIAMGASSSGSDPIVPSDMPMYGEMQIIMKRQLTLDEQQRIEGYWAHTFNHTDLLPAAHPYKNAPPYV